MVSGFACNQIFGLDATEVQAPADATYFDAPADAPFACPAFGQPLLFSRLLHQIPERCINVQISVATNTATAFCSEDGPGAISMGSPDGGFRPVPSLAPVGNERLDAPQLVPEGDQLFVRHWNTGTLSSRIEVYAVAGDAVTLSHEITMAGVTFDSFVKLGHPTAGTTRRMFMQSGSGPIWELSVAPDGAATVAHTYSVAELGLSGISTMPSLTSDGLRAVFVGFDSSSSGPFYLQRMSIADKFSAATYIPDIAPTSNELFMTDDCGRLYLSAIGNVFWQQRL